jgi:hypothetical protein
MEEAGLGTGKIEEAGFGTGKMEETGFETIIYTIDMYRI